MLMLGGKNSRGASNVVINGTQEISYPWYNRRNFKDVSWHCDTVLNYSIYKKIH